MKERKSYIRLKPETWSEIDALWQSGSYTLEDLAERYGITIRGLQFHFKKAGVVKGSLAESIASAAHDAVIRSEIGDYEARLAKSLSARADAFDDASRIQALLRDQLSALVEDPANASKAFSTIKYLNTAIQTLERVQSVKTTALAVEPRESDELPVIKFMDLSEADLETIHRSHGDRTGDDDDDDSREWSEDDDGVIETHE
jgi:hypothetical protein